MGYDTSSQYSGFETRQPQDVLMFVHVSQVINPTWLTRQPLGGADGFYEFQEPIAIEGF